MIKNAFVVVGCAVALAACGGEEDRRNVSTHAVVSAPARDLYALGTTVTREGAVPADSTGETFPRGGEVYLSVNVQGASVEQEIHKHGSTAAHVDDSIALADATRLDESQ